MSQPTSSWKTPSWDPVIVLGIVNPDKEKVTCVGHAISESRRCSYDIARQNRLAAAKIMRELCTSTLDKTKLKATLTELASRLLCRKYHQRTQVQTVADHWYKLVKPYVLVEKPTTAKSGRARRDSVQDDEDSEQERDQQRREQQQRSRQRTEGARQRASQTGNAAEASDWTDCDGDDEGISVGTASKSKGNSPGASRPGSTSARDGVKTSTTSAFGAGSAAGFNPNIKHEDGDRGGRNHQQHSSARKGTAPGDNSRQAENVSSKHEMDELRKRLEEELERLNKKIREQEEEERLRDIRRKADEARREEARKQAARDREEREAAAKAKAERDRIAEEARLRREREAAERRRHEATTWDEAWQRYEAAWERIPNVDIQLSGDQLSSMLFWPTRDGSRHLLNEAEVKKFFLHLPGNDGDMRARGRLLRRQCMRWHPDKAKRYFAQLQDQEDVMRLVTMIAQVLNSMKD